MFNGKIHDKKYITINSLSKLKNLKLKSPKLIENNIKFHLDNVNYE